MTGMLRLQFPSCTNAASLRGGACRPVFLTYASDEDWYGSANRAIREAARRAGTTLVDCERNLAESRATYPNEILFYPNFHPRAPSCRE
ncbi:MAG: hypothetical protein CMJ89_05720 [Planctomycetes bacterium]|jgi:hypothetical protein|nr:hypothetical protein [Planctomycetota bacterium]